MPRPAEPDPDHTGGGSILYSAPSSPAEDVLIMERLVILVNGQLPDLTSARLLFQPGDVLYAADGGTRYARELGLVPSVVIGDLDSLTPDDRQWLDGEKVDIRQYPRDKAETDLELALDHGIQAGYTKILIVGALGGRLDQTLGNMSLLTLPAFSSCDIRLDDGKEEVIVVRGRSKIRGKPGDIVSLIPWGGEVTGVWTEGLRWPLCGEVLLPGKTRGISNEMLTREAGVEIASGVLLCIHLRMS
jgi:thiamine pyrophosphokinase